MADISLTNSTIYAQNINNFTGELFKVGGQRTPLLSAVGGLNGGKVLNSTFWQVQVEDNATISSEPNSDFPQGCTNDIYRFGIYTKPKSF
jgi:hypothetical protein